VKGNDKTIFVIVGVVVLAGLFWMMAISPKREEASKLDKQAEDLRAQVSLQQQTAVFGEQARREFPVYYGRLVTLGKAVPEQADSASLMIQLNDIAGANDVEFAGITLSQGTGGSGTSTTASTGAAPAAPATPEAAPPAGGDSATPAAAPTGSSAAPAPTGSADAAAAAVATPAAPATEATAAAQPIGAVVGPAGLSTLPYELTFGGGFFDVASYLGGLDSLVEMSGKQARVDGRLLTVDGFGLKVLGNGSKLDANFAVTTYVTPPTEGLTAGASPTGPAPSVPTAPAAVPASTVTP
jgi:hypothetical protein